MCNLHKLNGKNRYYLFLYITKRDVDGEIVQRETFENNVFNPGYKFVPTRVCTKKANFDFYHKSLSHGENRLFIIRFKPHRQQ